MEPICQDRTVGRRAWILFAVLSAVWGASYLFIKIGLRDGLPAPAIVFWRTALAAAVLLPLGLRSGALAALRGRLAPVAILAAVQVAAPFLLITFGEVHISSSLTGILVGTAPIWTFLLAFAIDRDERASGVGLAGVAIGMAGVVLLLGVDAGGTAAALLGGLMVVLASLGYALGAYYLKRNLRDVQPVGLVGATMAASAIMTAPLAALDLPSAAPGLGSIAAVSALGVVGTGLAFVIFYELIGTVGPAKASLVAYVAPGFAVIYGVVLLGEGFGIATAAGLLLIIAGSWLAADGRLPARRQLPAGGVDVAAPGEPHRGRDATLGERAPERRDRFAARA
jgi:drug/metabolite transporter (DMT)-like permease